MTTSSGNSQGRAGHLVRVAATNITKLASSILRGGGGGAYRLVITEEGEETRRAVCQQAAAWLWRSENVTVANTFVTDAHWAFWIFLDTNISTSTEMFNFLFERNDLIMIVVLAGSSYCVNLLKMSGVLLYQTRFRYAPLVQPSTYSLKILLSLNFKNCYVVPWSTLQRN